MPFGKNVCSVEGCTARYFAKGYCGRHYQRLKNHGHLEETRPTDWGSRRKHPRYQQWQNVLRRVMGCAKEWEDFDRFLADTGERESKDHGLFPIRPHDPMGPDNFRWVLIGRGLGRPARKSDYCKIKGCNKKAHALDLCTTHHARWLRTGTTDDPEPRKVDHVKKFKKTQAERLWKYGITTKEYMDIYNSQEGKCKICKKWFPELVVDHEHTEENKNTRKCAKHEIRGLLCTHCNVAIGMIKDSVDNLKSAIVYLEDYAKIRSKS